MNIIEQSITDSTNSYRAGMGLKPLEIKMDNKTKQETVARIESNYFGDEIVSETIPQDPEAFLIFRDEIVKHLEGGHADYNRIGLMFITAAAKYAEDL